MISKKISSLILRVSITAVLLIFLFWKTDVRTLNDLIIQSDSTKISIAFTIFLFLNFIVFLRWRLLIRGLGVKVHDPRLFFSWLSAQFFNLVLPSTIGGDAVRTWDIATHTKTHSSGILATVLLDRLSGFFGLITILVVALFYGFKIIGDASILFVAALLLILALFLTGVMFSQRFFNQIFRFLTFKKLKDYLYKIHEAASSYKGKRGILVGTWLLSLLAQGGVSVVYYFVAEALGVHLAIIYFLVFVPMITAFSVIPISVGGLGLRDTASVYVFAKVGLAAEKAFALTLIHFGFLIFVGILGGASYVLTLHRRRI